MIILIIYILSVVACFISFAKLNRKMLFSQNRTGIIPGTIISICPVLNLVPIVIYFVEHGPGFPFFKKIDNWFRGV